MPVTLGASTITMNSGSVIQDPPGTAPSYLCRAWVNFNGTTSPPTIRASGNVSSITDNGVGEYTVNFTTAMPDANYGVACTRSGPPTTGFIVVDPNGVTPPTTASVRIGCVNAGNSATQDTTLTYVAIFR